jgi:membrane protein implicated in regulation of membrane protease activity
VDAVGGGLFLVVLGAIVAFAVNADVPGLNVTVTGIILMLAGAVVIAHARQREKERDLERHRTLDIEQEAVEVDGGRRPRVLHPRSAEQGSASPRRPRRDRQP